MSEVRQKRVKVRLKVAFNNCKRKASRNDSWVLYINSTMDFLVKDCWLWVGRQANKLDNQNV